MRETSRSCWAGVLIGVALIAAVDEIVFHQLLGWHHFYDGSTSAIGLLSDGLLHAGEVIALVAGFFMLLDLRRSDSLAPTAVWPGFFLGAGSFQLFDGLINHKLLRLHQIRYDVPLLPYDLAWNLVAIILILVGMVLGSRVGLFKLPFLNSHRAR